jgi:hypothetical protein
MNIDQIKDAVLKNGGVTLDQRRNPARGLKYVSSKRGYERVYSLDYFKGTASNEHIENMLIAYNILAKLEGAFVGLWMDEDRIYLDLSFNFSDREECLKFGKENGQKAIYDAVKKEVIPCE